MGDRSLNRGMLLGIVGGVVVFILFLLFFMYLNSDFDHQLINEKKSGVSTDELTNQIESESLEEKQVVYKHLKSHINDMEYWSKTDIASKDDFQFYIDTYNMQIQTINDCEKLRKEYIHHEISENYYINKITYIKERLES